jgi:hypothetical protein
MMNRRWGGLAVLVAGAAIGLAACSGAGSSSPHVASLGNNSSDGPPRTTTTAPAGSPAELLDEWASCMRSHGDSGQVDPTVDADKVIQITLGAGYNGQGLRGESGACGTFLSAAQTALGGGTPPGSSSEATGLKFARCMRANGVPGYPDPTAGNQVGHTTNGLDMNSPTFQAAATLCAKKTGYQSKFSTAAQPGSININMAPGFGK